jgi:hypothetical protein
VEKLDVNRNMNVTNAQLTAIVKEIPELTLIHIKKKADKIKESCRSAIRIMASEIHTNEGDDYGETERNADSGDGV